MTETVYEKLADALNSRGGIMPVVKCREVFHLLQELFTPEEAELATKMPLNPIPAETLAKDIRGEPKDVENLLETMANKGLVYANERDGVRYYNLMQLVPLIFETQFWKGEVSDRSRKLARLFEDYFNVASQPSSANPTGLLPFPYYRVIPVEKEIPVGVEIHPFNRVSEYVGKADYIAVSTCYCRHHGELLGHPCDKPKDVCLTFGPMARFIAGRGFGRGLSREEALQVLDRAEKAGLMHCSSNVGKYIDVICNCCGCHCQVIRSIKNAAVPSMAAVSSFIMSINEEECTGCGACVDRCQMDALTMQGDIVAQDAARCVGCGLCISVCPTDALRLEPREGSPVPPFDRREFNAAVSSSIQQNR